MAKYIKQEMNNLQDEEKPKAYYRMQVERNIDTDELVHLMSVHRAGVSDGIIKAVLMQLAQEVDVSSFPKLILYSIELVSVFTVLMFSIQYVIEQGMRDFIKRFIRRSR